MSRNRIKRNISGLMALLLCLVLVISAAPAAFAAEGSCGNGVTWRFEGSTFPAIPAHARPAARDSRLPAGRCRRADLRGR